jgi:hypothetical protein
MATAATHARSRLVWSSTILLRRRRCLTARRIWDREFESLRAASGSVPAKPLFFCRQCAAARSCVVFVIARGDIGGMSRDDASDFRPRPGRIRDRGGRGRQPCSFVAEVMRAAAKANVNPLTLGRSRGKGRSSGGPTRPRKGKPHLSTPSRGQRVRPTLSNSAAATSSTPRKSKAT